MLLSRKIKKNVKRKTFFSIELIFLPFFGVEPWPRVPVLVGTISSTSTYFYIVVPSRNSSRRRFYEPANKTVVRANFPRFLVCTKNTRSSLCCVLFHFCGHCQGLFSRSICCGYIAVVVLARFNGAEMNAIANPPFVSLHRMQFCSYCGVCQGRKRLWWMIKWIEKGKQFSRVEPHRLSV